MMVLHQGGNRGIGEEQQASRNIWKAERTTLVVAILCPFYK